MSLFRITFLSRTEKAEGCEFTYYDDYTLKGDNKAEILISAHWLAITGLTASLGDKFDKIIKIELMRD